MASLAINLLGTFQVILDDQPVTDFATDKARALLAYLAVEADYPHSRETLAGLLWPDQPERKARQNLRQALSYLRQAIDDRGDEEPFLLVSRGTVQFNLKSDHWLDVGAFVALISTCQKHRHRHIGTCRPCLRRLVKAIELYRGGFLEQFFLSDSAAFEEWALLKREWLHRMAVETLSCLADYHERRGNYGLARQYVWRQVELDPWREEAHRQLMRLLVLDGQRSAALAQYEACCRVLAEELGVEPTAETVTLYKWIRAAESDSSGRPAGGEQDGLPLHPSSLIRLHNLPPSLTPFIGREEELAQLDELLADPDCRLLTLVGQGGIGKTRLALQAAANQIGSFPHGIFFVPLASEDSPEFIVFRVADALGFSFHGQQDPQEQLLNYLREKELLLVLDNLEHLLEGTGLLAEMLQRNPGEVIIATSRERLNLHEEWVYEVEGLGYPTGEPAEVTGPLEYSAIDLFVQSARRVLRRFSLAESEIPFVIQICQMVNGMPLGIELAAAWVRVRTCEEIAQEITRNLDILTTSLRNVPERHRSLRAAFEHSWNLLSEQEQSLFRKLSVFRGGFESTAAEQVADASVLTLCALLDKSLLRRNASGRYEMHGLLWQYAAQKLEATAEELVEVQDRHCVFFATFLEQKAACLQGRGQRDALEEIGVEIKNVQAGWRWAVEQNKLTQVDRSLKGLSCFYLLRGPFQEGETLIRAAVNRVRAFMDTPSEPGQDVRVILARLFIEHAKLLNAQAVYDQTIVAAQAAVELAQAAQLNDLEAFGHFLWGQALRLKGSYAVAKIQLERALVIARAASLRQIEADNLLALGSVSLRQGDYATAERHYHQALSIFGELGDQQGESDALNNLGVVDYYQGSHTKSIANHQRALRIRREVGDRRGEGKSLNNLGNCAADMGNYVEARVHYERALRIYNEIGYRRGESIVLNNLSALFWSQGDYTAAWNGYDRALQICREIGDRQGEGQALSNLSLLSHLQGDDEAAFDYGQQALLIAQELGDRPTQGEVLTRLGYAQAGLGRSSEAAAAFQGALALRRELGLSHLAVETLAGLAHVHLTQGDLNQAQAQVEEILSYLEANIPSAGSGQAPSAGSGQAPSAGLRGELVEPSAQAPSASFAQHPERSEWTAQAPSASLRGELVEPSGHGLDGTDEPFRVYLTCYRVLCASQDPRAQAILGIAHRSLQAQAAKISDAELRRSFLDNVAVHREILAASAESK